MKINWKVRLKNKAFIVAAVTLVITFIYQAFALLDIVPTIGREEITDIVYMIVSVLGLLGVLVDPTTDGLNDSDRALTYGTDYDVRRNE